MDIAYCTNAVAGPTLAETRANVVRVFGAVRAALAGRDAATEADGGSLAEPPGCGVSRPPGDGIGGGSGGVFGDGSRGGSADRAPLPIGLWLSERAAHELARTPDGARRLRDEFGEHGLEVASLNAFPYHAFHAPVVKHRVYEPSWADASRLLYTVALAEMLPALLPAGATRASISTVPVGWRPHVLAERGGAALGLASAHLQQLVRHLARVEERTGVRVHVDLEPEPGCLLDRAGDAVAFLEPVLARRRGEPDPRRYLGVCHDICHAAVMFESQREALTCYRSAGIRVGKVQVSSAPECQGAPDELAVLASFAEPRYLHQTCVRDQGTVRFYEDLPQALADAGPGEWRTHFHVPVFAGRLGALGTTQDEIHECLREIARWPDDEAPQVEVETYAWSVLPETVEIGAGGAEGAAEARLAQGMAAELRWTARALAAARPRKDTDAWPRGSN